MKKILLGTGILLSAYLLQAQQVKVDPNAATTTTQQEQVTRKPIQNRNIRSNAPKLTPEQKATKQVQRLDNAVQLSEVQKKDLYDIYLKQNMEKAEVRERHAASQKAVDAVLTPEQKIQLEAVNAEKTTEKTNTIKRGPIKAAPNK